MIRKELKEIFELTEEIKRKKESYERLFDIVYKTEIETVKAFVDYFQYTSIISDALDTKDFTEVEKVFSKDLENPIKVINISRLGSYGYDFDFCCFDKTFTLEIPIINNLNTLNFEWANRGKIYLGKKDDYHVMNYITTSFDIEDIKTALMKEFTYDDEEQDYK